MKRVSRWRCKLFRELWFRVLKSERKKKFSKRTRTNARRIEVYFVPRVKIVRSCHARLRVPLCDCARLYFEISWRNAFRTFQKFEYIIHRVENYAFHICSTLFLPFNKDIRNIIFRMNGYEFSTSAKRDFSSSIIQFSKEESMENSCSQIRSQKLIRMQAQKWISYPLQEKKKIYPIIDLPLEFHTRISSRTKQKPTEAKLESIPRGERERIYLLSLNCRKIRAFVSRGRKLYNFNAE